MTIFITGAAGYIGRLLIDHFLKRSDVDCIIGLDTDSMPVLYMGQARLRWVRANTRDKDWQAVVSSLCPTIVIHAAWHIRQSYFFGEKYEKDNIEGSNQVFDFVFFTPSVRTFIHISSVAVYGALQDADERSPYTELDMPQESDYCYGRQKLEAEKTLEAKYQFLAQKNSPLPSTVIIRPTSLTGPRYFTASSKKISLQGLFKSILPIFPITRSAWGRQFLHEQDFCAIIDAIITGEDTRGVATFNLASDGGVAGVDIARQVHKRIVRVHPVVVRVIFFLLWHLTLGKIPTSKGGWRFFCYPLIVDGSKFRKSYGYQYRYSSQEAFSSAVK